MKKIIGKEKSVNDLLARKRYTIHYYQREYRWGKKQIEELIDDLTDEFLESYDEAHIRKDGASYGHYYLGSVVITSDDADRAIIDGQQRLTSLTLLLIYLEILQKNSAPYDKVSISDLIYSEEYGSKSFNISVDEREPCLNALFKGISFDASNQPESVQTIYARYKDIEALFPEELEGKALPFFIEWLIKKVYLVEITAYTEQDAHKIFVSMNDRGLSLTPTEMLKGFLLSEIKDNTERNKANDLWKRKILELKRLEPDSKEEDADFIKNWLRAQYAVTIRETKKGAEKEDFDLIGTEFHKWVRENAKTIGLNRSEDYESFVLKEFKLFADVYCRLKEYSKTFNAEYEYVFYNANRNFTFQHQIILAAIDKNDLPEVVDKKIKLVSCFVDQYIALRVFNFKSLGYSTIKNAVFNITKNIRRLPLDKLAKKLEKELKDTGFTLDNIGEFYLNQFTSRYMLHFLSRITHFVESGCGLNTKFEDYVSRAIKNPYDIEHIWADHIEQHADECKEDEEDFQNYRNSFGALLILPRDKNRSFQDAEYNAKLPIYFGENMLARSLNEKCYQNNPQFLRFIANANLKFKKHNEFKKKDIEERQELYKEMCKIIWNQNKLAELI
jgi:uncharacterized protein with ParB-like and HNH nuclease domain